jgi:two-component sensor histidine kinase
MLSCVSVSHILRCQYLFVNSLEHGETERERGKIRVYSRRVDESEKRWEKVRELIARGEVSFC